MSTARSATLLRHLHQWAAGRDEESQSDRELLRRFTAARDEAAFAALVGRHGPMVLSVCRRVLARPQDVEDAFQATFLVLIRKADSPAGATPSAAGCTASPCASPSTCAPTPRAEAPRCGKRRKASSSIRWNR